MPTRNPKPQTIAVLGAGGFGTALALVFSRVGHDVTLWSYNSARAERYRRQGFADQYPWQQGHAFSENLRRQIIGGNLPDLAKFDFVVVTVPFAALKKLPLLEIKSGRLPTVVLVQKGLDEEGKTPVEVFAQANPKLPAILFTGAGFAEDLSEDDVVYENQIVNRIGMIIAADRSYSSEAERFKAALAGTKFHPAPSVDVRGVCARNAMRTVASFQQGVAATFLHEQGTTSDSTLAISQAAIAAESRRLAAVLSTGSDDKIHYKDQVSRVLDADLLLCQCSASRNYALGVRLVEEEGNLSVAQAAVVGAKESLDNAINAYHYLLEKRWTVDRVADEFPYLCGTVSMFRSETKDGYVNLKSAVGEILRRHDRCFK